MWDYEGQCSLSQELAHSPLQFLVASWGLGSVFGQRSKHSNTGKGSDKSAFLPSLCTQGTCFLLDCRWFLIIFPFLTLLWNFLWSISWYPDTNYFYDLVKIHTKVNVYMKYSLPFYFAFKSNWAEHFNGMHCVDKVTLDPFILVKDCTFSILP